MCALFSYELFHYYILMHYFHYILLKLAELQQSSKLAAYVIRYI